MIKILKLITITSIALIYSLCVGIGKPSTITVSNNYLGAPATTTKKFNKHQHAKGPNMSIDSGRIKYIGHRGIGGLAPENTLPAFKLAGKLGFWGAECDVHTTSDGTWVILHDNTVDRTTNGKGPISSFSFSKLHGLNVTSGANINKFSKTKIPKLKDYLVTCKKYDLTPVIEMKFSNNLQYYDKFIEILKDSGIIEKTIVISFSTTSLDELRKRDSSLSLGLLCDDITQARIDYVQALGNTFIDCLYSTITKEKVNLCHEHNILVGAWTVDDIPKLNLLIENKVDYLTTNKLLPRKKKSLYPKT